jgi:hypothetical protein
MTHPSGWFWIPPPLDREAARQEDLERKQREESLMLHKKEWRQRIRTGRQLEQARLGGFRSSSEGVHLTREEVEHFNLLVRSKLCASRESICEAMAILL